MEGDGPLTATRTWTTGAELATGVATTKAKGGKAKPLEEFVVVTFPAA